MIKNNTFFALFISATISLLTFISIQNLYDGDITKYKRVYNFFQLDKESQNVFFNKGHAKDVWGTKTKTLRQYYSKYLTSTEYLHYFAYYVFSIFVSYEIYLCIINFLFVFLLFKFLASYNVNFFIILTLIFTNYYLIQFYLSLERLKIAFICLLFFSLFAINSKKHKSFYISGLLFASLAHIQMILIFIASLSFLIFREIFKFFTSFKINIYLLLFFISITFFLFLYLPQITHKINSIWANHSLSLSAYASALIKFIILYILTLFYSKKESYLFITSFFVSMFVFSLLIGSNRLIIICFFFFLIFGLKQNGGLNFGVILLCIYFSIKSYGLFYSIYYCNSLNYEKDACQVMYKDPYTRLYLENPNLWHNEVISPSVLGYEFIIESKYYKIYKIDE